MKTLNKFLQEQNKLPKKSRYRLSQDKINVLKLVSKFSNEVYKQGSTWYLVFDGPFDEDYYIMSLKQRNLSGLSLLNILVEIGWPGFKDISYECNKKIIEIMENK